jgi:hypothetical protein
VTNNYEDSVMKYRKKPVVIEATQWLKNGDHPMDYSRTHDGLENGEPRQFSPEDRKANNWEGDIVRYYRHPEVSGERTCIHCEKIMHDHGWIDTLEGGHIVCPGDWIITGIEGEHYPCKPHIFEQTYESAAQQSIPDIKELVEALEGLLAIVSDSSGVAGYHLNGEIAEWCEFEEVAMAEEALALYRQQKGEA